jgi:EAL and modified HD-GYP domain-containing signal transduction protein
MVRVYVARQPILDRDGKIFAYELLFRTGFTDSALVTDGRVATARVIESLISIFGIKPLLNGKKGFINVDDSDEILKILDILPSKHIGFEVLEGAVLSENFYKTLVEIRSKGYTLALDDFSFRDELIPYLGIVDFVKIDVLEHDREELKEAVRKIREGFEVKLIAEKVENYEMFKFCSSLGFEFFQGFFFQEPQIMTTKTIEPQYAALIRLYNLLSTGKEIKEIEAIFKKFSDLSLKLLQLINSAYYSLRQPIKSIRHAILMLGYRNLLKWILLLMYSLKEDDFSSDPLFEEASIRGFFMERLADWLSRGKDEKEEAFMVGVLSLIDVLLGVPMEIVVSEMNLEKNIKDALLSRRGQLGEMLTMVESVQRGKMDSLKELSNKYSLTASDLLTIQTEALKDFASLEV